MEIIEIPSKNSAFRPYRQSPTVGQDAKGSHEGSTMMDDAMKLSRSSKAALQNGFKLPPWVGANYKRPRTKLVKTRNFKNERNKKQATEDAGNCTMGQVAPNISVPIKTIRLFGQDYHYVCHDATNAGGGSGNSGGGGSSSGQNTAVEEGSQKGQT